MRITAQIIEKSNSHIYSLHRIRQYAPGSVYITNYLYCCFTDIYIIYCESNERQRIFTFTIKILQNGVWSGFAKY